jgi:putative FmdB family regulatory protein
VPTYEYECKACHYQFERKQRFDEEPVAICPRCQGKCHRVIHSVPVIFKGSGFYITDNRKSTNSDIGEGEKVGTE